MSAPSSAQLIDFLGRLHPVLLHLPIGILVALGLVECAALLRRQAPPPMIRRLLATALALSALAALATGLLLARDDGPLSATLAQHRAFAFVMTAFALLTAITAFARRATGAYAFCLLGAAATLIPTGHLGGSATHGEGFLTAPFQRVEAPATVLAHEESAIQPLFDAYCISCHGAVRPKGGLTLASATLQPGDPAAQELLHRLRRPLDAKGRMPPASEPQPSEKEIRHIERLLADHAPRVAPEAWAALAAARVHVEVIDPDGGLLWLDFAAARDLSAQEIAALLEPVAPLIAELSLAGTQLGAARLPAMPRLHRLDLSGCDALIDLASSPALESLALYRLPLDDNAVERLAQCSSLRRLYLGGGDLSPAVPARLRAALPQCTIIADEALTVAALETEPALVYSGDAPPPETKPPALNTHCPVSGAAIDPRYTILYQGRTIAFCCPECALTFWADPGRYRVGP